MMKEILILSGIMLLPLIEIRLAIPVGILSGAIILPFGIQLNGFGLNPLFVFILAIIMGFILGFILFNSLHIFDKYLQKSRFSKRYLKLLHHAQKKIHPYIEKYGFWGLAVYISLPIPGTGVYMGSLGGYVLGISRKRFYLSLLIGVTTAATIVTILTVLGKTIF